jgi:hypothetical protein
MDAVESQAIRTAPDHNVAVVQGNVADPFSAHLAAPQEDGRQTDGHRHDRLVGITSIAVLVQRQARPRGVSVDQAGVRMETIEAGRRRGFDGQVRKWLGHRWPRATSGRIDSVIPIACVIGDPAGLTAVGQRHRHLPAARRNHVAER